MNCRQTVIGPVGSSGESSSHAGVAFKLHFRLASTSTFEIDPVKLCVVWILLLMDDFFRC